MILGRWILFAWSFATFLFAGYAVGAWSDWILAFLALGISTVAYAAGLVLFEIAVLQRLVTRSREG